MEDLVSGGGWGFLHLPICSELSAHSSPFPFFCPSHLSTGAGSQIPSSHCRHVRAAALGCQTASLFLYTLLLSPGQGSCQGFALSRCGRQCNVSANQMLSLSWGQNEKVPDAQVSCYELGSNEKCHTLPVQHVAHSTGLPEGLWTGLFLFTLVMVYLMHSSEHTQSTKKL